MTDRTSKEMIVRRRMRPTLSGDLPQTEDVKIGRDQILFGKGQWLPSVDPLVIGKENFADIQNLRYGSDGFDTIKGHAKINATALSTYLKGREMHQLVTPYTTPSRILVQAFNAGLTAAQIIQNLSVVPSAADFAASALGATAAAQGRFANWPAGHVAFCDGQSVKVWAGDEMPVALVSLSTHPAFHDEYTAYMRTDSTDADESLPLMVSGWNQSQGTLTTPGSRDLAANGAAGQALAGRFQASRSGYIHGVSIKLKKTGSPAGNLVAHMYSATGTYPDDYPNVLSGIPYLGAETGDDIITEAGDTITTENTATSTPVPCDSLSTDFSFIRFDFPSPVQVDAESYYWIVITADGSYAYVDGVTEVVVYTAVYTNTAGLTAIKPLDVMDAGGTWNHKPATDECLSFQVQYKIYVYLGCPRPAQGFKNYINAAYANDRIASLSLEYGRYDGDEIGWTGVSDLTDPTASAGKTHAQTGSAAFTTPALQRPIFLNGVSMYWYRMSFSAWLHIAEITQDGYDAPYIYQITADCPWQDVKSLWSGESMVLTGFKINDGSKNLDYTAYMNDESQTTGTETQLDSFGTSKKIYIQTPSPAQGFMFRFIPGSYNGNAEGILTSDGTAPTDGDTVTIGSKIYTFKTTLTPTEGQVLIGASAATALDNLKSAINHAGAPDTDYKCAAAHPDVAATTNTDTQQTIAAKTTVSAAAAIAIATTETSGHLSWGNTHLEIVTATMRIRRFQGAWAEIANYVDKTSLTGAAFGQNGMVAFDVDELDKTLSLDGETPYYTYEISFSATLSSNVELFHVTGIEAPRSIDGYVFPFMFRNRPLLCGYTKGQEGNRVDFGMTDTVDVFTGSDASLGMNNAPLYFGGNEALTAAIEMYNRLGSTIYHVGIFCKAMETYLLSGYDAETWQIYRISGAIGCPAPRTMDTVEIGYGSDQSADLRCIALWLSFVGPVLCDTATVTPVPGLECYFDRNDSRCINWSAVEKSCGIVDLEYLEYHLCIPSGSGQTTNNAWLVFDLMKKRWYRRVANDGNYPQAFCRVVSTNGTPYIYACYDDGFMRRINTGDTWDTGGTGIACVLRSGDILPTGDMWDVTRMRHLKLLAAVAAAVSVAITHYKNGASSGTSLSAAALTTTSRFSRNTQPAPVALLGWSHQYLLSFTAPAGGATLIGMAWEFTVEREDLTSASGG